MEASKEVKDYKQAQVSLVNSKKSLGRVDKDIGWKKSSGWMFKVNWDAAFCAVSNKVGIDIVIRDAEGELIAALCKTEEHVVSPKIAEILALKRVMV